MKNTLKEHLEAWERGQVDYLVQLYRNFIHELSFFQYLVELCIDSPELQVPATWLIKYHYGKKHTLKETTLRPLLIHSKDIDHWETQLHILQILPQIELSEEVVPHVEEFVRKCLAGDNKFVRAWAYQGLFEISKYIPELREELLFLCERAMEIESASVKARVRKILKRL